MDADEKNTGSDMPLPSSIFTEQFLTFLTAVRIAIDNDTHARAKVVLAFSDLQNFILDKDLSPGQIVSILSTSITTIMQEKNPVNFREDPDAVS